jgi:hypothetical protein
MGHFREVGAQPVVDQDARMLWVVLKLDDVVMTVGTAHEMTLRAAAHPADVLNGLGWHGGDPIDNGIALTGVVSASEEAGIGLV